jgi:16S rRNA (cytosine967-C5)-methyltransferase
MEGLGPRHAALVTLDLVGRGEPFATAHDRAVADLEPRDRRLAHQLAAGVLRHQAELDAALEAHLPQGLASVALPLRRILRLGAYQLLRLDRVPAHAAVATAVDLARAAAGPRSAGFVNAVLRKVAGAGASRAPLRRPADGAAEPRELARRYSHPLSLVRRWCRQFGPGETERLLAWNNRVPPLIIQPARWSAATLARALEAAGVPAEPAPFGAGLVVTGRPTDLPGYAEGGFVVQDPAQAMVIRFAAPPADAVVYDACAAPGGKTIALGRVSRRVVAGEARLDRARRLAANLRRAGSGREGTVVADATHPPVRSADLVLLDVPCLGTGTFARHPDARRRATPAALPRLAARQSAMLDAAAQVVRPEGFLVYSTCSLEPEENESQVSQFLARHPEFRREPPPPGCLPRQLLSPEGDLQLLPQRDGTDGAFAARLRRTG